jgi:tetratricopeptide (TPR) repeat protein
LTNAIVSGQAKTALLIDGETLFSFSIDTPEIFTPRRKSDFRFLFGEVTDLRFIQDAKQEDVLKELQSDYDKTCALDLALMLLDVDISETKSIIAEALEELLTEENIIIYLESIFYAKPLPPSADTGNALSVCKNVFLKTFDWLSTLIDKQDDITWVRTVWDNIATDVFGDEEKRDDFQKVIVHEGILRQLVLHCRDNMKITFININAGKNKFITALPNHRTVLQSLFTPFRQLRAATEQKRLERDEEDETVSTRQKGRLTIDRQTVKNNVQSQIDYITTALKKRDITQARNLTSELINYQSGKGEPIHLVKSLCQLAQNAKELGFYEFQLELIERAISLEYRDAWTQAQYGDALLQNNQFDEALKAYDIAISFSMGKDLETEVVAKTGYAEVLKTQGKLDIALQIYEEIIKSHPENVVARNGYADVLKTQGRLSEALEVFKEIIKSHPENVVARNSYADVLKTQGRLNEALKIYEETIKSHPENVVARNSYADVLKTQGRLNEALEVYEETIKSHPEDVFSKNGYAEVLKTQGRLSEALKIYEETIKSHPEDVVAKTGYADVLKTQGRLSEALEVYEETIKSHPEDVVVRNGYADVLKTQGRLSEALEVYEETIKSHPENVFAKTGLCGVLFALGRYNEALGKLPNDNLTTHSDWIGYHMRGMIMLRKGNLAEAIKIFEKGEREDPIPSSREYFRSALAIARLRQGAFKEAGELLDKVTAPLLQPTVNLLRVHAFGEQKMYPQAENAFREYENAPITKMITGHRKQLEFELASELKGRYVTNKIYNKDDDWLFDKEEDLFLLALAP